MATEEEKMRVQFLRGLREKARRERNFQKNNEAYATIREKAFGVKPEELGSEAPANEEEYNKRYERGLFRKSQVPAYKRTNRQLDRYWAEQEANNTPAWQQRLATEQMIADQKAKSEAVMAKDGNGVSPEATAPKMPENMTQQEFNDWMAQENRRQSTWNAAPEATTTQPVGETAGTGAGATTTQPAANAAATTTTTTATATGTGEGSATTGDDDAADYAAKYDEAGKHYDETHKDDKTFIDTIGVDPARQAAWDQRKADNEKRRKQDALWRGLSVLADLGIAAAGGNVYKRTYKDSADYDRQRQLIEAEEAAAADLAEKQRQTAMENYNKRRDTAAKAGADAWLKEKTQAEQNQWRAEQNQLNRDAKAALNEMKTSSRSGGSTRSGGGRGSSGGNNDGYLHIPNSNNEDVKVRKSLVAKYANQFLKIVLGTTQRVDNVPLKAALADPRVGVLKTTDGVNYKVVETEGIPNFMLNGAYPEILKQYVAAENLALLDEMYEVVLSSGSSNTSNATSGRSQNGGRQFSSGGNSGNSGNNGGGNSRVITYQQ